MQENIKELTELNTLKNDNIFQIIDRIKVSRLPCELVNVFFAARVT